MRITKVLFTFILIITGCLILFAAPPDLASDGGAYSRMRAHDAAYQDRVAQERREQQEREVVAQEQRKGELERERKKTKLFDAMTQATEEVNRQNGD